MTNFLSPEAGPATLKITRWGGVRLAALRGGPELRGAAVGESWEFSTLPGQDSRADGQPLLASLGAPLPFLAKLIDTALPLSVQVHPGDDADGPGKEEAWVVLDADADAHVWAGLAPGQDPAAFRRAVAAGAPLLGYLRAIPVVPGSVILVPARTVHAIGGGILLAEIQQPRDCTYRFHDHGSERPIQPAQALATVDLAARPQVWSPGPGAVDLASRTHPKPAIDLHLAASRSLPVTLRGRHVALEILGPGAHRRDRLAAPSLIIPVRGRADACTADERRPLGPGALTLARRGGFWLELAPDALCVLGSVDPAGPADV